MAPSGGGGGKMEGEWSGGYEVGKHPGSTRFTLGTKGPTYGINGGGRGGKRGGGEGGR